MDIEKRIDQIKANSQMVIDALTPLSGIAFGLNEESVVWVDGYIERLRAQPQFADDRIDGLVNTLGSFLGECVRANAGGTWHWSDEHHVWSIVFANNSHAFPFAKVRKQFANGMAEGDSIASFYNIAVNMLAKGKLGQNRT